MFMTPHSHLDHFHAHVHTHTARRNLRMHCGPHTALQICLKARSCVYHSQHPAHRNICEQAVLFLFSPVCICIDCTYYSRASVESPEMSINSLFDFRFLPVPYLPFHISVSPFPSFFFFFCSSPPPPLLLPPTSVLQLRLQQRRTREQLADQGIMPRE